MPIDIVIYAVIAAVMVFWLRNVLGTRHGEERQRPNPFDPANQPTVKDDAPSKTKTGAVDQLSPIEGHAVKIDETQTTGNKSVDAGLVQIALADKNFDAKQFKENASDAFVMIVSAFAEGDKDTLRDLCGDDVYDAFANAIDDRVAAGETLSTEIHAVRKMDITDAGVEKKSKQAFVTIRFTADETYVISDANGDYVAGHPDRVTEMTDKWTFARDTKSTDPRWFLIKTDDDVVEQDGKTPLPDAG